MKKSIAKLIRTRSRIIRNEKGFNLIEFLILAALVVVLILIVVPNINVFLGVDKKLAEANIEAQNVRSAALAYKENEGKFPSDSNALWDDPPLLTDYIGAPRAYYTIDIATGRIINASVDNIEYIPSDPWNGIRWDYESGSWVKE